jgi:phage terminase large subunit-like protein
LHEAQVKETFLAGLTKKEAAFLLHDWRFWARPDQWPPEGSWTSWLVLGGRGAGKTRTGAEWVRGEVMAARRGRLALIGETYHDARDVMVEGPSGLRAIGPVRERPRYEAVRRRLLWENGAVAQLFSASDPEALRGPQFDGAWCDELAKWRHGEAAFDMLQFGLRLGEDPRQVITTTPRPVPLLKRLLADARCKVTRAASAANRANLADGFFERIVARYEGTRLGRQELEAELLEDNPDALWSRGLIEAARVSDAPPLTRIVVAVDPPASSGAGADECGIVAAGMSAGGHFYVLEDASRGGLTPLNWARRAAGLFNRLDADRIIAESNQGGEMVEAVLRQAAPHVPVKRVHAARGKQARAEPVAALYERGLVHHLGCFAQLEDQLCECVPGKGKASPDRLDALVWALSELAFSAGGAPQIRRL